MTKALAVVLVLVGCGTDGPDGGEVVERGVVTVFTHPGMRVDFMSAATDEVISSGAADADGKAEAEIDIGDRAVIVGAGQVRVLDQLEPTKEYRDRWYVDGFYRVQPHTAVAATWPAVASAVAYQARSLCGGTTDYLSTASATIDVCNAGDGIIVTAYDANYVAISSAYQVVASPPAGGLAITAAFEPHRDIALTLGRTPGATIADLSTSLITAEGALLSDEPFVSSSTPTITAELPAIDGSVRTFAMVTVYGVGTRWLIDRRPVADSLALDMNAVELPYVTSLATKDSTGPTVTWNQSGTGTPTLVMIGWKGPQETSYTLMTRYTGTTAVLPVLPADIVPPTMPSLGAFAMVVASPDGYEAAIEALARQRDPLMHEHSLYFSTYY